MSFFPQTDRLFSGTQRNITSGIWYFLVHWSAFTNPDGHPINLLFNISITLIPVSSVIKQYSSYHLTIPISAEQAAVQRFNSSVGSPSNILAVHKNKSAIYGQFN